MEGKVGYMEGAVPTRAVSDLQGLQCNKTLVGPTTKPYLKFLGVFFVQLHRVCPRHEVVLMPFTSYKNESDQSVCCSIC